MMRLARLLITLIAALPLVASSTGHAAEPMQMRRWLGAEGAFGEVACFGTGQGCLGMSVVMTEGGSIGAQKAGVTFRDPDLVERVWPARTGYRFFRASVPGPLPATAYLTTAGAEIGSSPPLTMSFGFRFNTVPLQPIIFFRQTGVSLDQTVMLTLTPEGRVGMSAGGATLFSSPLSTQSWHAITVSYGTKKGARAQLYVDEQPRLEGEMRFGGPSGPVDLGIVSPTVSPFALGIDDIVEVTGLDQPIRKARINYLMPYGNPDKVERWTKEYPYDPCEERAQTWQLISEDQRIFIPDPGDGTGSYTCNLEGFSITAAEPNLKETYSLEGIPSAHMASERYHRDVTKQPETTDTILGARLRVGAYTDGTEVIPLPITLKDQGPPREQIFPIRQGSIVTWGPTYTSRSDGQPWSVAALDAATITLDSGPARDVKRWATLLRLDYVWVPSG